MENEKSLVKAQKSIFSRVRQAILNFFHRFNKNKTELQIVETTFQEKMDISQIESNKRDTTAIQDFDILKDIVNGKIQIKDLDIDTEKRLIKLCDNRLKQMNEKIREKDIEIANIEKLLNDLKVYQS